MMDIVTTDQDNKQNTNKRSVIGNIPILIMVVLLVAAIGVSIQNYYYGPCGTVSVKRANFQLDKLLQKWIITENIVLSTPWEKTMDPIQSLQVVRKEVAIYKVPRCMKKVTDELVSGMDNLILMHLKWRENKFVIPYDYDKIASKHFSDYKLYSYEINKCAPFCKLDDTPEVGIDSRSQKQPTKKKNILSKKIFKSGDLVTIGDSEVIVYGWDRIEPFGLGLPVKGNKYISVELLIINKSHSLIHVSSMEQMRVIDESGNYYNVDFMASRRIYGSKLNGDLSPGEKVMGEVGFQVPENTQEIRFEFNNLNDVSNIIVFDLGREIIKIMPRVMPPDKYDGESPQQYYNIGEEVASGATSLKVNNVTFPTGDTYYTPLTGNKFIVIDINIKNNSHNTISVSTLWQMWLIDSYGQKYYISNMALMSSTGLSSTSNIAPGEILHGQVGFEVLENTRSLVMAFADDIWGKRKILVKLY